MYPQHNNNKNLKTEGGRWKRETDFPQQLSYCIIWTFLFQMAQNTGNADSSPSFISDIPGQNGLNSWPSSIVQEEFRQ
jgi:hypothetical protein